MEEDFDREIKVLVVGNGGEFSACKTPRHPGFGVPALSACQKRLSKTINSSTQPAGVGKTSMIRRFCKGIFTDEYKKTIGVDFLEKALFVDALGEEVRFMLWDTGGQSKVAMQPCAYASTCTGGSCTAFMACHCPHEKHDPAMPLPVPLQSVQLGRRSSTPLHGHTTEGRAQL